VDIKGSFAMDKEVRTWCPFTFVVGVENAECKHGDKLTFMPVRLISLCIRNSVSKVNA
jgi:hypothetical protein